MKEINNIPNRQNWIFSKCKNGLLDKDEIIKQYIGYMLARTQTMFDYKNLPKTIPKKDLEILIQVNGFAIITKVKGELYAFYGGLGGVLNEYYLPTIATIANPYLNYNANLEIDKECVIILNDNLIQGLTPMFERNAKLLAECDISMQFAIINSRLPHIVQAQTDNDKKSLDELFKIVIDGTDIKSVISKTLTNGFNAIDFSSRTQGILKDLIETKQYLLGSWYQELGLNANYNMKRESLNKNEIDSNEDILIPLIDEMLQQRKEGIKKVNDMFGTDIEVELSSSWKKVYDDLLEKDKNKNGIIEENELIDVNTEEGDNNETN